MAKILIVDQEEKKEDRVNKHLREESYQLLQAHDEEKTLKLFNKENPALVIINISSAGIDGLKILHLLRQRGQIPVIMLSNNDNQGEHIRSLELGADDFLKQPLNPRELTLRIKRILSRTEKSKKDSLEYPQLKVNRRTRIVTSSGQKVDLTPKEFELLWILANNQDQVFKREHLLEKVWGYDYYGDPRTVDTHIKSLRKKLNASGPAPDYIQTVWGVGYKFSLEKEN